MRDLVEEFPLVFMFVLFLSRLPMKQMLELRFDCSFEM